jgi:hypothetical protein
MEEENRVQVTGRKARGSETTMKAKTGEWITLRWVKWDGVGWIGLAQDR